MDDLERQHVLDEEHLRLLRIGYLTMGGVTAVTGLLGLVYVFMGAVAAFVMGAAPKSPAQPPSEFFAWFFIVFGFLFFLFFSTYAVLAFFAARALRLRRARMLCLIVAGLSVFHIPFGTILGVFTFIVFNRPTVLKLFTAPSCPPPPPPLAGPAA